MKVRGLRFVFVTVLMPFFYFMTGPGTGSAEMSIRGDNMALSSSANVGVQQTEVVDGAVQKFEEYRDIENGFFIDRFLLGLRSSKTPYYLDIEIKNPVQEDEFYSLEGGKRGKFNYNLTFDAIPHNFSTAKLLHSGIGSNRLVVPNVIQSSLEALEQTRGERGSIPAVDTTGEDALTKAVVDDLFATADTMVFQLKREKTGFTFDYYLSQDVKTWATIKNEKRTGVRVANIGSYERYAQGAAGITHTEDLFLVSGMEVAEPINYRTLSLGLGIGVYKEKWVADLDYTLTTFDNRNIGLLSDNPFRITDASATNASDAPTANAYNRGRFVVGQRSLPPDSESHDLNFSMGVDLPHRSRLSGSLGYGWTTQDAPFLPYSLNSALSSVAGFDVTNPQNLPESNLDGDVKVFNQSYILTSRPIDPIKLTLKYRYYDYKNNSSQILFPGYAAFGESYWRTVKNDPGAPVENEPQSYTRQNATLEISYKIRAPLTLMVEGGWDGWDREHRFVKSTDEWIYGLGFDLQLTKIANLRAGYKFGNRTRSEYEPPNSKANPEAAGKVNFDLAGRKRDRLSARLQVTPRNSLSFGLFSEFIKDEFEENARFGLKEARNFSGGMDISYSPSERVILYASYTREDTKNRMNSGAKDDKFNDPATTIDDAFANDNWNPLNYWNTTIDEDIDTFGFGTTLHLIPNKLIFDAGYSVSLSDMSFDTFNPNGTAKLANAAAKAWPTIESTLHEIRADLSYRFTKTFEIGLRYQFEKYELDNFMWSIMQPFMAGASVENSTRYTFSDATYDGYQAHVGGIYFAYRF